MDSREALVETAEWVERASDAGETEAAHREVLANAIRVVALARLRSLTDASLAEDLAQVVTGRVLAACARRATTAARLPAYVDEAARNAFRDHRRRASTKREALTELGEMPVTESGAPTPEAAVADAQESRQVAAHVRALLADAPSAYREVLTRHYLEERPIQELVEDEVTERLRRDGRDPWEPLDRARLRPAARQCVDQRLCRARTWLQQRLAPRDNGGAS